MEIRLPLNPHSLLCSGLSLPAADGPAPGSWQGNSNLRLLAGLSSRATERSRPTACCLQESRVRGWKLHPMLCRGTPQNNARHYSESLSGVGKLGLEDLTQLPEYTAACWSRKGHSLTQHLQCIYHIPDTVPASGETVMTTICPQEVGGKVRRNKETDGNKAGKC